MAASLWNVLKLCKHRLSLQKSWQIVKYYSESYSSKSSVNSILNLGNSIIGSEIKISGWVKSVRKHKDCIFFHISDGSGPQMLQVVTSPDIYTDDKVSFANCVTVHGKLVKSPAKGQDVELVADSITLHGDCDSTFPFNARHKHSPDYCRDFLHLRPKTDSFASLLRVRSAAAAAFHSYFQKNGFLCAHTPVITSNDCEGGGKVFKVDPLQSNEESDDDSNSQSEEGPKQFFRHPVFLTVSGQLHLEALASAFSKVYCFGPTFRAENSRGRHHLCEFWMLEAEVAFVDKLQDIMQIMEEMVKETCQVLLQENKKELDLYYKVQESKNQTDYLEKLSNMTFERVSYSDAVELLEKYNQEFQFKVQWGKDLQKEHEKFLTTKLGHVPVFITDFPSSLKPFYTKANNDGKTVAAVDLLVPGVGELIGGSLREDNIDLLHHRLELSGLAEQYKWYLDLRRFGSSPHGGFGLGFERFLQFILGTPNIKDTIPFPRWSKNCQL